MDGDVRRYIRTGKVIYIANNELSAVELWNWKEAVDNYDSTR